jgi:hypothetical protein
MGILSFLSKPSPVMEAPAPTEAQLAAEIEAAYVRARQELHEADEAVGAYAKKYFDTRTAIVPNGITFKVGILSDPKYRERIRLEAVRELARQRFAAALEALAALKARQH